ncbi:hypothetical protein nbrc107696_37150 [Gordonia spumicola]|uniref:Uncharacterized protein n=1 Tax=Gordonia spumicola TaxID=589161 RepID=A0A7I9VD40_9ACTN|nr:DUF5691 domain-containing protein [Gordonia spumicola]GEE03269.1 hypothetical protein nbrc107696_37150 [Gordonia spumicola]
MTGYADWHREVTTAAVLGTDRRPPPSGPPGFTAAPDTDSPRSLLDQVALAAALVRGGRVVGHAEPTSPAPPETDQYAPETALAQLRTLLAVPPVPRELRLELLVRWLRAAASRSVIVPPEFIPPLSAHASGNPALRTALADVWGERGRWLAPRLGHAAVTATTSSEIANAPERWPGLSARDKEQLLRAPDGTVTGVDDAFLESCLDERAARVRDAARDALSARPTSAFARRMGERLASLVDIEPPRRRLLGSTDLVVRVRPPADLDDAAARDGLPGTATDGDRAASLRAIVRSAPLHTWTTLTGSTPEAIATALAADDTVLTAVSTAAITQRDRAWAAALTPFSTVSGLIEVLGPRDREAYVLARLPSAPHAEFIRLIDMADRPWPAAVASAVLDRLASPRNDAAWASLPSLPTERAADVPSSHIGRVRVILDAAEPATDKPVTRAAYERRRRFLHAAVTFHAFDQSIQESFA